MSKIFITASLTVQEIQNAIDTSKAWDTFLFESGASFALDKPLSIKGEGRYYDGNGCTLYMSDSFQASEGTALHVFHLPGGPQAKRNILQWIGYFFLRLAGKHPRTIGATITNFSIRAAMTAP